MTGKEFTINGNKYVFFCTSEDTRHGFKHVVELHKNGYMIQTATAYYLNRTWETFRYQAAMLSAVYKEMEFISNDIKHHEMVKNGWKKMTKLRRDAIAELLKHDKQFDEINAVCNAVRTGDGIKDI